MWHRHRGGRAVRGHALPPLPHLPHLPPPHPTSTDCRLASLALSLPTSCCRTFATDTTALFPAVWLPPIPPSPNPPFPSLLPPFTFLTATLLESPSGLLFTPSLFQVSNSSHFAVSFFPARCVSQWDPGNIHRCISFSSFQRSQTMNQVNCAQMVFVWTDTYAKSTSGPRLGLLAKAGIANAQHARSEQRRQQRGQGWTVENLSQLHQCFTTHC